MRQVFSSLILILFRLAFLMVLFGLQMAIVFAYAFLFWSTAGDDLLNASNRLGGFIDEKLQGNWEGE